ncbi:hypothetical protein QZH41_004609 [Actinostola sp. cb2023]|nr:hypothetical protein QZH41_004609 [Actinostola sp. cb2023]
MRPILSAKGMYNYDIAKWLKEKLKPLSSNEYTINDIFQFASEIQQKMVDDGDILVFYDVTALFASIPVDEAILMLTNKAFHENWFNKANALNLKKEQLIELLETAVKHQLFQMCRDGFTPQPIVGKHMEDKLKANNEMPSYYRRFIDDMLAILPNDDMTSKFLN